MCAALPRAARRWLRSADCTGGGAAVAVPLVSRPGVSRYALAASAHPAPARSRALDWGAERWFSFSTQLILVYVYPRSENMSWC